MKQNLTRRIYPFLLMGFLFLGIASCEEESEPAPVPPAPEGTVTDIDGNVYNYITIGGKRWMMEDLKVTTYRNGTPINDGTTSEADPPAWVSLTNYAVNKFVMYQDGVYKCLTANTDTTFTASKWVASTKNIYWWTLQTAGAYSAYDNDSDNGLLYNWYAVNDTSGLAPEGWRIPTTADWNALCDSLGGAAKAGEKLKEWGNDNWMSPNYADNSSGFTALPAGIRFGNAAVAPNADAVGDYRFKGSQSYYWELAQASATNGWSRILYYGNIKVTRASILKGTGTSVRCVQDIPVAP